MQETERFVRDLVWAVNSPPLMDLTGRAACASTPLQASEVDGEQLRDYLATHREQRVGRYFERLILFWLRFIRRCEIVAHSLQLREGKRTVGEIDLLFRDELGRLNHWEIACKFYLHVVRRDVTTADYIGPNAQDTLHQKASRLQQHQIPLGIRYFPEVEVQEAFVKGRIFYHWKTSRKESPPVELATRHLAGRWLRAGEVLEQLGTSSLCFRILQKPFWLAEEWIDPSDDGILTAAEATGVLQNHFHSRQTPILLSGFRDSTSSVQESERWFVVPNHWPR